MEISVFGLGYVGTVSAVGLARLGHRVIGVDIDQFKVDQIARGVSPVVEPGIADLLHWAHEADRLSRRTANARTNVEKVTLRRQIAEIAGGPKPSKAELRNAVRKSHAADAPKPYDAIRPATPALADHSVRPKRRLPVEDW